MKLIEYLKEYNNMDIEMVIGNVDMPCTFSWCGDIEFTEYCMEKYGSILNSEIEIITEEVNSSGVYRYTDLIVKDESISYITGEQFSYAYAGYISEQEYDKLFKDVSE